MDLFLTYLSSWYSQIKPRGGGGALLYVLYKYMRPKGYGFFGCFGHKLGIDFGHIGLKQGLVFALLSWIRCVFFFRRSYVFIIIDKTINKSPRNVNIGLN